MKINRNVPLCFLAVLGLGVVMAPTARANYVVTVTQSGGNVVANGSGAIDTSNLGSPAVLSHTSHLDPSDSFITLGTASSLWGYNIPSLAAQPFGTGGLATASSSSGSDVGINVSNISFVYPDLYVPENYVSDTNLTSGAIWSGSFASLGLTPGTYTWAWGSGANQSFTLDIVAPSSVPEPASILLMATALVGLGLVGLRRRQVHPISPVPSFRYIQVPPVRSITGYSA